MLKNPIARYRLFLGLEMAVVIGVILIFRIIENRGIAGSLAGALFLFSTLAILGLEWKQTRHWTWTMVGGVVFLVFSVLPILVVRALTHGTPFDQAEVMGLKGRWLHQISNYVFLIFLVGIFISLQKERAKLRGK